jgi:hypothetical protein
MPVASDISPNTDNLLLGAGFVRWKGVDDDDYRDLGEVLAFELTIGVTVKPHVSKRHGTRFENFSATEQKTAEVKLSLEEHTSDNLVFALLGTKTDGPPIAIEIGTNVEIFGALRFVPTNDVGPRIQVDLPLVKITPSSALNLLNDNWGALELAGKVYGDPDTGSFGRALANITDEVT